MQLCSLTDSGMDNFTCPSASQRGYVTIMSPGHCCKTAHCPAATNEKSSVSLQYNVSIHYTTRLCSLSQQHLSCTLASSTPNGAVVLYYTTAALLLVNAVTAAAAFSVTGKRQHCSEEDDAVRANTYPQM